MTDDPVAELAYIRTSLQFRATGMSDSVGSLRADVGSGGRQVGAIADLCRLSAECWGVVYAHADERWEWGQPDPIAELGYLRTLLLLPGKGDELGALDRDCWAVVNRWRPRLEDGRRLPQEVGNG